MISYLRYVAQCFSRQWFGGKKPRKIRAPRISRTPRLRPRALQEHDEIASQADRQIYYSDRCGTERYIGAVAVSLVGLRAQQAYLGTRDLYDVNAAELYGIFVAMRMAKESGSKRPVTIFTDSTYAMRTSTRMTGERYPALIEAIQELRTQVPSIEVRWIPGHKCVAGNTLADALAGQAAKRGGINLPVDHA